MQFESIRLSTFATYPRDATLSALELAHAGFIYTRMGNEIRCFSCGWHTARFNISFDEIVRDHTRLSSACTMVKGETRGNVNWSADPKTSIQELLNINNVKQFIRQANCFKSAKNCASQNGNHRIKTFTQNPYLFANKTIENVNVSPRNQNERVPNQITFLEERFPNGASASAGNGHWPSSEGRDNIQSHTQADRPVESRADPISHSIAETERLPSNQQSESTNQSFIAPLAPPEVSSPQALPTNSTDQTQVPRNNNGSGELRPGPTYSELGIITEMPKRSEYAPKAKRLETFSSWPRDHHLSPDELSEAGFYYAGYGDCSRCFYCGGGLRNWEDEDDVWVEHARWFPKCAFIRGKLGNNFIDIVQDLSKQFEQISLKTVIDRLGHPILFETDESNIKKDPAVRSVVDLGYNEIDVVEVVGLLKDQLIPISADVILEELKQEMKHKSHPGTTNQREIMANPPVNGVSLTELKERNNQLRQQTVCKICLDKDVSVVFLPCGHLVSCTECSIAMRHCPVCRTNIKGIVRALMC